MVAVGDRVEVVARRVGREPRRGRVTGTGGPLVEVRWDSGGQTAFVPAAGSLTVLAPAEPGRDE